MSGQHISDANLSQGSSEFNGYLRINLFCSVTLKKILLVQPEPTKEQSMTTATIGAFLGGTAFGSLAHITSGRDSVGSNPVEKKRSNPRK